jgi:hypothetical protein
MVHRNSQRGAAARHHAVARSIAITAVLFAISAATLTVRVATVHRGADCGRKPLPRTQQGTS